MPYAKCDDHIITTHRAKNRGEFNVYIGQITSSWKMI